jgi:integrase
LYTVVADEFVDSILKDKTTPDQITEADVIRYDRALEARGLAKTTRSNRYVTLRCFLRHVGLDPKKLIDAATNQKLKTKPVTIPEIYSPEEFEKLIAVASPYNALAWTCFAQLGFRDEELATLRWEDIDWVNKTVSVRYKPGINWKPKDHEERDVPCSDSLLAKLADWRKQHPDIQYVLGTSSDRPNNKFLQTLKRDWKRSGQNCGVCGGCTKIINVKRKHGTNARTQNQCERAYLRKSLTSESGMLL